MEIEPAIRPLKMRRSSVYSAQRDFHAEVSEPGRAL